MDNLNSKDKYNRTKIFNKDNDQTAKLSDVVSKPEENQAPKNVQKVNRAQEMCERAENLAKLGKWNKQNYEKFIKLTTENLYYLDDLQVDILKSAIFNCPSDYKSLVLLSIIDINFRNRKKLDTFIKIIPKFVKHITNCIEQEYKLENVLPTIVEHDKLKEFLLKQNSINHEKKINLCRNIISILIIEEQKIYKYADILLEYLSGIINDQEDNLKHTSSYDSKELLILDYFKQSKPSATEAKRIFLYGNSANTEFVKYKTKIDDLESQNNLLEEKLEKIKTSHNQCLDIIDDLQKKLDVKNNDYQNINNELAKEKQHYQQLSDSLSVKIDQERKSTINQVHVRIAHELAKLERCFNSRNVDSFQENQKIGLKIIEKIKNQLK